MFRSCRMPELIMFWAFVLPQARKSASPLTPLMSSRGSFFICDCSLSSTSIFSMSSSNNSFCAHTLSYIVVRSFFITSFLSVKIYFLIIVIIKILYIVLRFLKSFSPQCNFFSDKGKLFSKLDVQYRNNKIFYILFSYERNS